MAHTPTPALDAWHRELRPGERMITKYDALWRAACLEISAAEADRDGLHDAAARDRARARSTLRDAARGAP